MLIIDDMKISSQPIDLLDAFFLFVFCLEIIGIWPMYFDLIFFVSSLLTKTNQEKIRNGKREEIKIRRSMHITTLPYDKTRTYLHKQTKKRRKPWIEKRMSMATYRDCPLIHLQI